MSADKNEKRAAALRENLMKRKAQAKVRQTADQKPLKPEDKKDAD